VRLPAHLSKTLYMRGLQCPKSLWLDRKQPEVRREPPPDLIARWDAGTEVGLYAQQLFPDGVEVPFDGRTKVQQLAQTRDLLAKGAQTIYEATFSVKASSSGPTSSERPATAGNSTR